jgi:hypothetical protein
MSTLVRRLVALVAVSAFAGTLALPLVSAAHQRWDDDPDCASLDLGPRHVAATFARPAAGATQTGHCALCHWLRAFAGATLTPVQTPVIGSGANGAPSASHAWWHGRDLTLEGPSRAPPALASL